MRAAAALLVVAGLSGVALAAQPHERRGKVVYATAQRVYLDKGRLDGLRPGDTVRLLRGKSSVPCKLEIVGDHSANCAAPGARAGDAFLFQPTASAAAGPAPHSLRPLVSEAERERGRAAIAKAPYGKVDEDRQVTVGTSGVPILDVYAGHSAWMTLSGDDWQQEHVHVSLAGTDLGWGGFRAYAQMTALHWTSRPASERFRPSESSQFYLYEAELASREVGRPYALALGRVWPWGVPGIAALDGAQVGWRSKTGSAEAGVFGGGLPDPVTTEPEPDRWIAGAYVAGTWARDPNSVLRLLRYEGRLATRNVPGLGQKTDTELLGEAWITRWLDAGAETRIALLGADGSGPALEAVRAHVGVRAADHLRVDAGLRYLGRKTVDDDFLGLDPFGEAGWIVAEGDATWNATSWMALSAIGGYAQDDESSRDRAYVGPELALPRLLGRLGGASIGYLEERGWDEGRSAFAQATLLPAERLQLILRGSYFEDRFALATASSTLREIGAYVNLDARLLRWLSLRGFVMARVAVAGAGGGGEGEAGQPAGLTLAVDLAGEL